MVTLAAAAADGKSVWWLWVLGGLAVSTGVAGIVGLLLGRGMRLADERELRPSVRAGRAATPVASAAREARRVIPIPPLGIALLVVAVALETAGYISRLTGATGQTALLLSMDGPNSVPRMYVAALFAAAALAAAAGAGTIVGRRTWWLAVALVSGGIAAFEGVSTAQADLSNALQSAVGSRGALLPSALAFAAVVGGLWFLSRTERRDRRRVLGVLALYAAASIGLPAVSTLVAGAYGAASKWAATATFLEESGAALAGVALLVAVLVGVAPRMVLPADWTLRRAADEHTLEAPGYLPTPDEGSAWS